MSFHCHFHLICPDLNFPTLLREGVCVWTSWRDVKLLLFSSAEGRSVMVSLLPTKTLTRAGDTRLGQSGVPSLFESGELLAQLKTMMQLHWLWRWLLHNFLSGLFTDPFLSGVTGLFLHVRSIPQQNSQLQFWACVLLTTVRQDAVSPSGNIPL